MTNQIYLRIGKPKMFRQAKQVKGPTPIKTFIIKWSIIIGLLYFFLDDVFNFLFGLI